MTHEELLTLLKGEAESAAFRMDKNAWLTVRDIVELHKPFQFENAPDEYGLVCIHCQLGVVGDTYPCETIQVIEKELL